MCKKVLLIGGGGTLGSYASEELLKKNCITDVICLENKVSGNKNLHYFNMNADLNGLTEFLKNTFLKPSNSIIYNVIEKTEKN